MAHFGAPFNLVDPRHTCRSAPAERINSPDVVLSSRLWCATNVYPASCPPILFLFFFSLSPSGPRATTPVWHNDLPIPCSVSVDLQVPLLRSSLLSPRRKDGFVLELLDNKTRRVFMFQVVCSHKQRPSGDWAIFKLSCWMKAIFRVMNA